MVNIAAMSFMISQVTLVPYPHYIRIANTPRFLTSYLESDTDKWTVSGDVLGDKRSTKRANVKAMPVRMNLRTCFICVTPKKALLTSTKSIKYKYLSAMDA